MRYTYQSAEKKNQFKEITCFPLISKRLIKISNVIIGKNEQDLEKADLMIIEETEENR